MSFSYICNEANRLSRIYETRNPAKIARGLGINVEYDNNFGSLKGMYFIIKRNRFIVINANLDERTRRTVLAHEIGHDRLHKPLARAGVLQEFALYDMRRRPEYEANIFAADLLIADDDILGLFNEGRDIVHIADELNTDINLALIKTDSLRMRGYDVRAPYRPQSDFLRN